MKYAPSSRIIRRKEKCLAYIDIPGFVEKRQISDVQYASSIADQLRRMDTTCLVGWIIDLQNNYGGNMWPMLAGLASLINVSIAGFFRDRNGDDIAWNIRNTFVGIGDTVVLDMGDSVAKLRQANLPIAVLTSNNTCSSGEAIVVALRGLERTRLFGESTAGLSTANQGFVLPDSSTIWVTTATFVDSKFREYGSRIIPGQITHSGVDKQLAVDIALDWLTAEKDLP